MSSAFSGMNAAHTSVTYLINSTIVCRMLDTMSEELYRMVMIAVFMLQAVLTSFIPRVGFWLSALQTCWMYSLYAFEWALHHLVLHLHAHDSGTSGHWRDGRCPDDWSSSRRAGRTLLVLVRSGLLDFSSDVFDRLPRCHDNHMVSDVLRVWNIRLLSADCEPHRQPVAMFADITVLVQFIILAIPANPITGDEPPTSTRVITL